MTTELLPIEIETGPDPRHRHLDARPGRRRQRLRADRRASWLCRRLAMRFIFPHAPMRPVTINDGYVMRAWYDIGYQDLSLREDEQGMRDSQRAIEALIERERKRGIAPEQLVLAGFSQGGAIALQTAPALPGAAGRGAGAVALTCRCPTSWRTSAARQPERPDPHGARHRGSDRSAQARPGLVLTAADAGLSGAMARVRHAALGVPRRARADRRVPAPSAG